MSGSQAKKERRAAREAEKEALRKQERQRTVFTMIVVVVVIAIGGVLVFVSLDDTTSPEDELAELLEGLETEGADDPDTAEIEVADREIACSADEPEGAGEEQPTFDAPEEVLEDGVDYQAVIETSCGTVIIDLDEENAPEAVNSFVFLAQQGFFDGRLIFRNATTIGALQTGAGSDDASWQVGYTLTDELETAEEEGYPPGSIAMANAGPNTAGSQFFLVYNTAFDDVIASGGGLEPIYTRFGSVLEGLDVLEEIGAIEAAGPRGEDPVERVYLESVTIVTG